jgi:hypothetical protein
MRVDKESRTQPLLAWQMCKCVSDVSDLACLSPELRERSLETRAAKRMPAARSAGAPAFLGDELTKLTSPVFCDIADGWFCLAPRNHP